METRFLDKCEESTTGAVVVLNQCPGVHGVWTRDSNLYTIIRNPGIHWAVPYGRWLSTIELGLSQGFPMLAALATPGGPPARCVCFCKDGPG
eukprot:13853726-Alexandrium_andersonii.AAC.1